MTHRSPPTAATRCLLSASLAALLLVAPHAQAQTKPAQDGSVRLDGVQVPVSDLLSPEGREFLRHLIVDQPYGGSGGDIAAQRAHQDKILHGFLGPMQQRYKVKITEQRIGGVFTQVVTPDAGIKPENQHRVLLNVHGGGFTTGARTASLVEAVPIAAVMGVKVISIDYRMGPEHQFPAGSEDVETVYREVLKTYKPSQIGLYGCSAGGILTAQSVAWFQSKNLPRPGAAGVFCSPAGINFSGDSVHMAAALTGMVLPPPPKASAAEPPAASPITYLAKASLKDPLANPVASSTVLAKFPPTLLITGTRSFELSAVVDSHNALSKAGVDTELFVWDGLNHAFFYNSEIPESREAYAFISRFFNKHLSR